MRKMNSKKGAMEMSVGTIVTMVLLMTVLVLGLYLVRTIFTSAESSIEGVDKAVKNEMNKLFSQDDSLKVIVYPATKIISIKKGNTGPEGFAFQIRNTETTEGEFDYRIFVNDPNIESKCNIRSDEADSWITAGNIGTDRLSPGSKGVEHYVRFAVPSTAPPCLIRYGVEVEKEGRIYGNTVDMDVEILPE